MKTHLRSVLFACTLVFGTLAATTASAAYCPVYKACSVKPCSCPSGRYAGNWTHKFKKLSLNLRSECRKGAKNAERALEKRYRGRNYTCRYRRTAQRIKNVLGYKTGWCKFRLTCTWTTRKTCRRVYRLGAHRTINGGHKYKFKGFKNRSVCRKAKGYAIKHIERKYGCKVTYFKINSYKYKKKNTLGYRRGYCHIRYTAKCARKIPMNCCSCSGR